jgi:3-hydroxyisobutyrate dehydrogenase-like beta-hydroxyacid dehydrogenase
MAAGEHVAFLGLGIMGWPMAANLRRAGLEVTAWNRTRERAEELAEEHGASVASTPAEAAAAADLTITMLPDSPEVGEVVFGENGAAEGLERGGLCIDMSTIAPGASMVIGDRLRDVGVEFLDAPVTGSRPKAEDGTLTIMVGGDGEEFVRARPAFEAMGELVVHVGPQGHGSMIKLINNTVAAVNAAALGEGLILAERYGVEPEALLTVLRAGSGNSTMLELKAKPMLERDFEALFKLEHMLKDVRYCLGEAEALGVIARTAQAAERSYSEAASRGRGESDFAAVVEAAEEAGGV